jgi:hypothetical protein
VKLGKTIIQAGIDQEKVSLHLGRWAVREDGRGHKYPSFISDSEYPRLLRDGLRGIFCDCLQYTYRRRTSAHLVGLTKKQGPKREWLVTFPKLEMRGDTSTQGQKSRGGAPLRCISYSMHEIRNIMVPICSSCGVPLPTLLQRLGSQSARNRAPGGSKNTRPKSAFWKGVAGRSGFQPRLTTPQGPTNQCGFRRRGNVGDLIRASLNVVSTMPLCAKPR